MIRLYGEPGLEQDLPAARMPRILWRADRLLRDYDFLRPFREVFNGKSGRPTIPLECYVRLMFLKEHFGWGYERLVAEVAQRSDLRRFSRIPLRNPIPHSTTLLKLTHRFGRSRLEELLQTAWTRLESTGGGDTQCSV